LSSLGKKKKKISNIVTKIGERNFVDTNFQKSQEREREIERERDRVNAGLS
jgi:hypothetical protein